MEFTVEFYEMADGTKPAKSFIRSLSRKTMREKIYRALSLLEEFGTSLRNLFRSLSEEGFLS
jgi:hypothetical protein